MKLENFQQSSHEANTEKLASGYSTIFSEFSKAHNTFKTKNVVH